MNTLTSDEQRGFDIAIGRVLAGLAGRYDAAVMLGNTARAEAFEDVAQDVMDWAAIPLFESSPDHDCGKGEYCPQFGSAFRKGTYRTITEHEDGTITDESGVA